MLRSFFVLSAVLAFALAGCSKPAEPVSQAEATPGRPDAPIDPCSLLTSDEIQGVVGEAVTETKSDRETTDGLTISQCHFALPTAANSFNLRLIQRADAAQARDPRKVWQETFARDLKKAMQELHDSRPVKVDNLGDEAFWLGGPKLGGLYVLKGNRYFRLGVGGESQDRKIETATKLGRVVLEHLPAEE